MVSPVFSFQNSAIRTEVLHGAEITIFGILNLVHGLAFQRDADRFVHAASGEVLGLFINVFNGFFYCVSVIAFGDCA